MDVTMGNLPLALVELGGLSMLWWSLAALIPLAIHLWKKRHQREVTWAAMRFLQDAIRQKSRRSNLEQILLLLIRMAVLILLGIAAAKPYWSLANSDNHGLSTEVPKLVILLVDTSYSMNYREPQGTFFQQAIVQAKKRIEKLRTGDAVAIVKLASPSQSVLSIASFDPAQIDRELETLRVTEMGADLVSGIEQIQSLIQQNQQRYPQLEKIEILILSDLGRNTWQDILAGKAGDMLRQLALQAKIEVQKIGNEKDGRTNLAVSHLSIRDSLLHAGDAVTIYTEILNTGSADPGPISVQLLVDGRTLVSREISIAPGHSIQLAFPWSIPTSGEHLIQVQLPDDPLTTDNQRRLCIDVRNATRILLIENKGDEGEYMSMAIAPTESLKQLLPVTRRKVSQLDQVNWRDYDGVVLCDVTLRHADDASAIRRFVQQGGGLIGWLGSQIDIRTTNQYLATAQIEQPGALLPLQLKSPSLFGQHNIDPREYRSPFVAPFRDFPDSGLLTIPIYRYWKIEPTPGESFVVDLSIQNGDPLIVHRDFGLGRAIWILSSLSPESKQSSDNALVDQAAWNALAAWPSFVPLTQEMVRFACGMDQIQRNVLVGETLKGTIASEVPSLQMRFLQPNGNEQQSVIGRDNPNQVYSWTYSDTLSQGIYQVLSEPLVKHQQFAVNVDTKESDLRSLSRTSLPEFLDVKQNATVGGDEATTNPSIELFRWVLAALLILMIVESTLAWHYGRQLA